VSLEVSPQLSFCFTKTFVKRNLSIHTGSPFSSDGRHNRHNRALFVKLQVDGIKSTSYPACNTSNLAPHFDVCGVKQQDAYRRKRASRITHHAYTEKTFGQMRKYQCLHAPRSHSYRVFFGFAKRVFVAVVVLWSRWCGFQGVVDLSRGFSTFTEIHGQSAQA